MLLLSIRFLDRNPLYLGLRISEATQLKTIDELATLDVPEEEQVSKAEAEEEIGQVQRQQRAGRTARQPLLSVPP
jgi:hypothetical protein